MNPADEAAIRALLQQIIDGWNKGSGDAFAVPFAEDSDFVCAQTVESRWNLPLSG
jgi:uncharacterized protein (TIGR02246 family)